jgi:hypothetical protein
LVVAVVSWIAFRRSDAPPANPLAAAHVPAALQEPSAVVQVEPPAAIVRNEALHTGCVVDVETPVVQNNEARIRSARQTAVLRQRAPQELANFDGAQSLARQQEQSLIVGVRNADRRARRRARVEVDAVEHIAIVAREEQSVLRSDKRSARRMPHERRDASGFAADKTLQLSSLSARDAHNARGLLNSIFAILQFAGHRSRQRRCPQGSTMQVGRTR